ncbi:MAG: hypothetical protein V1837_06940 [Candidatus Woesearchaeota archaeon]
MTSLMMPQRQVTMESELELFQEFFGHFLRNNYTDWQKLYIILTDTNFRQQTTISGLFLADKAENKIELLRSIGSRSLEKYLNLESHDKTLEFLYRIWLNEQHIKESDSVSETLQKRIGPWSIPIFQEGKHVDSVLVRALRELDETTACVTAPRIYNASDYRTEWDRKLNAIFGGLPNEQEQGMKRQDAFFGLPCSKDVCAIVGFTNLYSGREFSEESFKDIGLARIVLMQFLEQQNQKEKEIKQREQLMSNGIAHYIRNPIVSIGGFARRLDTLVTTHSQKLADYLTKAAADASIGRDAIINDIGSMNILSGGSVSQYCRTILNEEKKLEELINNIRELSNPISLDFADVDINQSVATAVKLANLPANIKVLIEYSRELPRIRADGQKLELAIYNVISDATYWLNGNGGEILISTKEGQNFRHNGTSICSYVEVSVVNLSMTMTKKSAELLFNPLADEMDPLADKMAQKIWNIPKADKYVQAHKGFVEVKPQEKSVEYRIILPK